MQLPWADLSLPLAGSGLAHALAPVRQAGGGTSKLQLRQGRPSPANPVVLAFPAWHRGKFEPLQGAWPCNTKPAFRDERVDRPAYPSKGIAAGIHRDFDFDEREYLANLYATLVECNQNGNLDLRQADRSGDEDSAGSHRK